MKTHMRALVLVSALAPWLFSAVPCVAVTDAPADPAGSEPTAAKPYTMYMGTNLSIDWKGQLRPVYSVEGASFIVQVDNHKEKVPVYTKNLRIKVDPTLKVTPQKLDVSHFKAERVYSYGADPMRQMSASGALQMRSMEIVDQSVGQLNFAELAVNSAALEVKADPTWGPILAADQSRLQSLQVQNSNLNTHPTDLESFANVAEGPGNPDREAYDAFYLECEVSANVPLAHPYAVLIARFHEDPHHPERAKQWVYAMPIDALGVRPCTVRVRQRGFPPGYVLDDVQLHIYNDGVEYATNLSRKQVALSSDQAFQLSNVQYIQAHAGATLPAALVSRPASTELKSRIPADVRSRTVFVKVGKDGIARGAYWDAACTDKVSDANVVNVILSLRFNPAMEKGNVVETVAPLHLDLL